MQPAFSSVPFSITPNEATVILGTAEVPVAGSLVAIELSPPSIVGVESPTPGAHLWIFDSATAVTTGTQLRPNGPLPQLLAPGVRLNVNQAFANGLTLLSVGSVAGNAIVQVA
jgi:hypothetical protein